MHKIVLHKIVLVGSLLTTLLTGAHAQSGPAKTTDIAKPKIGAVSVDFQKATLDPNFWHLTGQAKITSADYDMTAADIKFYFAASAGAGASSLRQAVAVGGAAPNFQVIAHIRRPLESETYEILADRAVYLPDPSRPSGGKMNFTGHVKVVTKAGFLVGPSVSTFDSAAVLLGAGSEYPQIETGPGHITLTPTQ